MKHVASYLLALLFAGIRCTAGSAYTVGLSDGSNFSSGWRRMRQGASGNYLRYELYKATISSDRWGGVGAQRRSSVTADSNPSIHDGATAQGYTYRAEVDPAQTTPPVGTYTDNVVVDVQF
ncbi:spore coat U domain-containing protein [Luteimonas salinilitoris]|uniref:Spore coat U domain-containing protein n=1 Tax=Luteimonas salinilitoris TaxID=3237697 RepID=A0ABV4HQ69_9GAMM